MMDIAAIRLFIIRHWTLVSFAFAFVLYALCTLFYMGGAATNCTESLLMFPGDNTAGLIAMFSIDNHDPWFGYTHVYSYPYGETLGHPTHITAQTLFIPFWALAKLFGPICGFNVLTMIGFMSASLTMFAFVRWLLGGRTFVALLAGFAVAFTPYLQLKTGGHISYVFEAVFIAAIWLFLSFWKNPTWKKAVLVGLSMALFAYTDGYFILLGGVLMGALITSTVVLAYFRGGRIMTPQFVRKLKLLAVSIVAAIGFMAPVLLVMLNSAGQINESLASTRDNISNEAQVYGARPQEYLLPNPMNPITSKVFGDYKQRDNHGSNGAENVISLSLVLLALAVYTVVVAAKARVRKTRLTLARARFDPVFVAVTFGCVFIAALLFSFPPKLGPFPMPDFFLIQVVQLWRVFARLSLIVNIAMVIIASFGLAILLDRLKGQWRRAGVCAVIFVLIFLEYLTFTPPRPVGGYEKVPEIYSWLHTQKAYNEIAEYPLDEFAASGNPVFYDTYQRVHGKKMLNGIISGKDALFARLALRDLTRPQAVPGLRALGIDFITIHSPNDPGKIPGLTLRHVSPEPILTTDGKPNKVWGYSVDPGEKAVYIVAPTEGFHAPIKEGPIHQLQEMGDEGVLSFRKVSQESPVSQHVTLQLVARSEPADGQVINIVQSGKKLWSGTIAHTPTSLSLVLDPAKDVHIVAVKPTTNATVFFQQISVAY